MKLKCLLLPCILICVSSCHRNSQETIENQTFNTSNTDELHLFAPTDYNFNSNEINNLTLLVENKGDVQAAIKLANYYGFVNFNLDKWVNNLTVAATNGDSTSQYNLGVAYSTVPQIKDLAKAKYWFETAMKSGNLSAKARLERFSTNQ
jgi:TPR repeat protein